MFLYLLLVIFSMLYGMVNHINQLVKVYILNNSNYGHGIVAQLYVKQVLPFIVLDEHPSPMLESVYLKCQPSIVR